MERNIFDKYYLSTEGYYFMYRKDRNDNSIWRATLYRDKTDERVDDVRVSEGYGLSEKTHHDLINYFMATLARISLNRLAEPADITLFINCKEPYAAFWIKKVHKSAQKNYISKK